MRVAPGIGMVRIPAGRERLVAPRITIAIGLVIGAMVGTMIRMMFGMMASTMLRVVTSSACMMFRVVTRAAMMPTAAMTATMAAAAPRIGTTRTDSNGNREPCNKH